jgi:hypothetical protein
MPHCTGYEWVDPPQPNGIGGFISGLLGFRRRAPANNAEPRPPKPSFAPVTPLAAEPAPAMPAEAAAPAPAAPSVSALLPGGGETVTGRPAMALRRPVVPVTGAPSAFVDAYGEPTQVDLGPL